MKLIIFVFLYFLRYLNSTDMDLANWMGNLPDVLHHMPLTLLAIPGSHDSFSYSITPTSNISPDEQRLQCFGHCLCFSPLVKKFIFRWTVTQTANCTTQLEGGIRYFDFRLAGVIGSLTPYVVHGMYGGDAIGIMEEIANFLQKHPREIVLLDFQHFYNFTEPMHAYLTNQAKFIFEGKICPFGTSLKHLRLSNLWKSGYQVFLVYRDDFALKSSLFWPEQYMPTPWPNTDNPEKLVQILEENYVEPRNVDYFYVTQGVLTPTFSYIILHIFSNLQKSMASKATRALLQWLDKKQAGQNGINIVIGDFCDSELDFCRHVINLNYKMADVLETKRFI